MMQNKMWTTKMLLDCIVRSDIKTSRQIKDSEYQQTEHAKIVALLKAFDLYVEEKQAILDKDYNKVGEEYGFDISDFLNGNFIRKRSKTEVANLLEKLVENRIIEPYQKRIEDKHSFLCNVFKDFVAYRKALQKAVDCIRCSRISQTITLYSSLKITELQIEKIDSVLLKIIGHKKPVSEKILVKKYGLPKDGILSGNKSLKEILAAL